MNYAKRQPFLLVRMTDMHQTQGRLLVKTSLMKQNARKGS